MTEYDEIKLSYITLKNDDTIFNELKELQKLVKKESAIKELFIKAKNETKKSIENHCVDIYKKKMEVLNILQKIDKTKINTSNIMKDYTLVENNSEYLSYLNVYIQTMLKSLWEEPKLVYKLLLKANKDEMKNNLAPLICNNFYENILSPNYIQDPLIYIIYLLLKNEIESFKDINEGINNFLNDTTCGYLLQQLIEKNDIKEFFKLILQDALEDLGNDKFIFNIDELNKWQLEGGQKVNESIFDKNFLSSKNVDDDDNLNNFIQQNSSIGYSKSLERIDSKDITENEKETIKKNINYQHFTSIYLTSIPISEIKENINKYKDDIHLNNYYKNLLTNTKGEYSQMSFFENLYKLKNSENILVFYQEHFLKAKEFINKIFDNIISHYRIIPYAIKCVSKIIYQLVNNKFPDSSELQKNLFINKFFYKILMFPIFKKPDINALINDYIISKNTINNIEIICDIIWILVSFRLFKDDDSLEGDLTPFNRVFLEKIPEIFKINQYMININLPNFIDGFLNKTINEDEYYFDYFNENPNDICFYKSMLLNMEEFNILFWNLLACKEEELKPNSEKINTSIYKKFISKTENNKKCISVLLEKLCSSKNLKLLSTLVKDNTKVEKVRYFHVSEILINEKVKNIFDLEQKYFYYHIEEIKENNYKNTDLKELQIKNNIIKCKNLFISILYNHRILDKIDFNKGTTNSVMDILRELTHFMKSSNYLINEQIPSEWYLISLMGYLRKLPDDYKFNEYKKLFKELNTELNESIKNCNFEYMSLLLDGIKFAKRNQNFQDRIKEIYIDIELNNKANNIIENNFIKEDLISSKNNIIDFLDTLTVTLAKTPRTSPLLSIEKYIKDFPNLNEYKFVNKNPEEKINIFALQIALKIPNKIKLYFDDINRFLKDKVKNEIELNIISDKISDYIMNRIYDKIYPKSQNNIDIEIFKNSCMLNWIETENIIKDKTHYDFDFVLPEINKYFNLIRTEKSPRKKLINLNNIFKSITKLVKFTKDTAETGVDDIVPLLSFCIIKCKPLGIFTNCKFMELYIGNKKNAMEGNQLAQILTSCDFIKNVNFNSFYDITETEYIENSRMSLVESREYLVQNNLEENLLFNK